MIAAPEQPSRSFIPPMPKAPLQGEEIANIRVSRSCTIRLLATGPWGRQSIESLVAHLTLGLRDGVFDEGAAEGDSED